MLMMGSSRGCLTLIVAVLLIFSQHIHGQFYPTSFSQPSSSSSSKDLDISISHLNILLPYVERATLTHSPTSPFGLEIEVSGGCFQWFMTNPEVARLEPRYDERGCSQRALVSATSTFAERKTTWIHVEEIKTGKVLRCEVDVDLIHKIEIISTTRTMYKEDVEVLSIQAFDSQGNWFSTLSGLEFAWSVTPLGRQPLVSLNASQLFSSSSPSTADNDAEINDSSSSSSSEQQADASLKLIPFSTSSVEVASVVLDMENQGKGAALALVQGTHTGRARVTARLAEAGYHSTPPASIVMSVLEPLQIYPFHTVYITRQSTLDYQLRTFKRDKYEVVPMPSSSYFWYSSSPNTGSITQRGEFTALELGQTEISIQAADITENQAVANVFVVDPYALQLTSISVVPGAELPQEGVDSQYFITDREYVFVLDMLDSQGHKLHFSPKLYSVQWSFTSASHSATAATGVPRSPMVCNATNAFRILCSTPKAATDVRVHISVIRAASSFFGTSDSSSSSNNVDLTLTQQLHVNHPVAIDPKQVLLPYDATVRHSYTLKASNGSGNYQWSTGDLHIVALNIPRSSPYSDTTTISTYTDAGSIGQTFVRAVDSRNPDNRASITVDSVPPAAMRFPPIRTQVQLGFSIQLPLGLFDVHGRVFSNCSELPLTWILSDPSIFALQPNDGSATSSSSDATFDDVAACTSKTLFAIKEGHSDITAHYAMAETSLSAKISISIFEPLVLLTKLVRPELALISPGASIYLEYQGGPPPLLANPSLYSATLVAQQPSSIVIEKLPSKRLPGSFKVTCLTSHEQILTFTVGNSVAPINPVAVESSLSLTLSCQVPAQIVLSAPRPDIPKCSSLGPLQILVDAGAPLDVTLRVHDRNGYTFDNISSTPVIDWSVTEPTLARLELSSSSFGRARSLPSGEFYRTLFPSAESGDLEIRATLPSKSSPALTSQLAVSLVRDISVSDDQLSIYNHPDNVALLEIYGGSGLGYQVSTNHTASINTSVTATAVRVTPLSSGTTRLTLSDPCLTGSMPVQAVVHVSYIGSLAVQGIDVIAAGMTGSLEIHAFDDRGARFQFGSDYQYMRFDIRLDAALKECSNLVPQSPSESRARFSLYGRRSCSGFVTVSSIEPGRPPVYSEPFLVHVFDPFKLVPQSITLLVGSRFQPAHIDGPPKRTRVSFELTGKELEQTSTALPIIDASTGLLVIPSACKVRSFDVVATVRVGDMVFGVDTMNVRVIDQLRGLRLVVPSQDLFVGGEVMVRVEGEQLDETPFVFASQPQEYKWTSSNSEVGALVPLDPLTNDFAVRFSARNGGYTRVSVRAFGRESPSVLVRVREPLQLRSPSRLLLAPGATYQIRTNKDTENTAAAPLQYTVTRLDSVITCTDLGLIVVNTSASYGHSAVQVYDPITGTAETVQVSLGSVHSMQVLPPTTGVFLPVGSSLELQIVFRDQHGRVFDAHPGAQLRTYTNVQEIVAVQLSANHTSMTVTALQLGEAIIRVSVVTPFDPIVDEYIRVSVSTAIEPVAPLIHTGGEITFRIASKHDSTDSGTNNASAPQAANWFSEKDSVLTIDRTSGRALARAVGETTIYHNSTVFTYTRAHVVQPTYLVVDPSKAVPFVSNANGLSYDLHVRAYTANNVALIDTPPAIRHNLVIRCSVVESQWAVVQTISSLSTGMQSSSSALGCRLRPLSPSSLPQTTQPPANLSLLVTVTDRFESYKLSYTHLVPLRSSFAVSTSPDAQQKDRIQLNSSRKSTTVQVTHFDAKSLHVSSSNPDSVKVENQGSGVFQLVRGHVPNTNVVVEFRDVVTGQVERLLVDVLPEESFYTSSGLASLTQSVIERPQAGAQQSGDALAPTSGTTAPPPTEAKAGPRTFLGISVTNIVVVSVLIASTLYFFPSLRPQRLLATLRSSTIPRQPSRPTFGTPRQGNQASRVFSPGGYEIDGDAFSELDDGDETSHWIKK